ncbi:asparagine synthase (glutamine-hydrolyzing) [Candidatus Uhrbacteria bacterium]|nr:MAG: asparagine synthase (glutamine-hydrolyzing) [Candidatus Uhrbacteria bacterium]
MCGIAGLIAKNGRSLDQGRLVAMAGKIAHRGPDGDGMWVEGQAGLAHRRLALVDLSPSGAQPMISDDGRYVITFNGEIYNYKELREEYLAKGGMLRSTSDTEILLTLFAQEGEAMLAKLRGMFAFAIWDKQESCLFFARDRIGKKPFFYRHNEDEFAFASEVKSLIDAEARIDEQAVRLFLGLQYVPSPLTGFKNIFSLEPGMCGTWKDGVLATRSYIEPVTRSDVSFDDAVHEVRRILDESVRLRLIADVPVGIFLSGGIDSSSIAALAHKQGVKLSSFTLGFDEAAFDERDQAAELAKEFGFEHHSFLAKPEDLLAIADEVIEHYDVPYADSSSLNTWILARETKKHVKAALTGDGGDELFGGYRRYRYFEQALGFKQMGVGPIAGQMSRVVGQVMGDPKFQRFADTIDGGYASLFCGAYFQQPEALAFIDSHLKKDLDPIGAAMDFDLHSYLSDDLNVKMDRASMRHGLEARCPLLDQELVSYVTSLPTEYRYKKGQTKRLLVEAVKDLLPIEIGKRAKRGFQVPLAIWFRGALRNAFVERCVNSTKLHTYVAKERVEKLLSENDRGSDHGNRLWMLYSLATWLEKYG